MKMVSMPIVAGMLITSPVFADPEPGPGTGKDLCLMDINNCPTHSNYNIIEKIARLRTEIEKGTKVYSPEEHAHLKHLLDEALNIAELIDADPSQVPENKNK